MTWHCGAHSMLDRLVIRRPTPTVLTISCSAAAGLRLPRKAPRALLRRLFADASFVADGHARPCRAPRPSQVLHQVRRRGCRSSPALSSPKGSSRQEIADIPRFAARQGTLAERGSPISFILNMPGANPMPIGHPLPRVYRADLNRSRCVALAPKPTWRSVSPTHMRCRMLASSTPRR